jgi:hypothetical protein
MITVANSAEYFINEFTQEIYDQVLDHVDFKSLECSCGAKYLFLFENINLQKHFAINL